jgi:hypothetical protein
MAISLEELATAALEGSVRPVTLAVGAVVVPGPRDTADPLDMQEANRVRDQRGRFVRKAANGVRPE